MCEVTLAVQKLSTTLNSQKKSLTFNLSAIKCNSSSYLLPASFKLVLLKGAKFIAPIFFCLASSKAQFKDSITLSPECAEFSESL